MFPAAESAFIITAEEILLGLHPYLFSGAATVLNSVQLSTQIRRRAIFLEICLPELRQGTNLY